MNKVNAQTAACSKLLASVITLAITDACTKPVKKVYRREGKPPKRIVEPSDEAIDALVFIFESAGSFIEVLGMDGVRFKQKLVEQMFKQSGVSDKPDYFTSHIEEKKRYNFRYNYTWLLNNPQRRMFLNLEDEDEANRHAELDDGLRCTSPGLDSGDELQTDGPEAL